MVLRGCLGYLVWCNENEARGEESDFIVWRDTSVFCLIFPIRHQPSLCTVAKASAFGLGAPSICDPAAGLQRRVLAPPGSPNFPKATVNSLHCFVELVVSIIRH